MIEKYDTYLVLWNIQRQNTDDNLGKTECVNRWEWVMDNDFFNCWVPRKKGKTFKIGEKTA